MCFLAGVVLTVGFIVSLAARSPMRAQHLALAHTLPARIPVVIVPGVRLGPDGKLHDAFTPTDLLAAAGQQVLVTVYNYDTGNHSFTAPSLHLNVLIPAARRTGVPAVRTFAFTVTRPGVYHWRCMQPCDDVADGWAMLHDHYMAGTITIQPA
jgi:hypothetical protein